MKITEIYAKTILRKCPSLGESGYWYNLNIYRGCTHGCIYCDSRSPKYYVDNFDKEIVVKINAPYLLRKELSKDNISKINSGAMSDSYMYGLEDKYGLTRKCLKISYDFGVKISLITKSNLIERDLDLWEKHSELGSVCAFTITTCDESLASMLEPNASSVSDRLKIMKKLSEKGICTGVSHMPLLPYVTDSREMIRELVSKAKENGATFIQPCFGLTLRKDMQRDFFMNKLRMIFPETADKYERNFKNQIHCFSHNIKLLEEFFYDLCKEYDLIPHFPNIKGKRKQVEQLTFF